MCMGINFTTRGTKLMTAVISMNYITHIVDDEGLQQTNATWQDPMEEESILRFNYT